MFQLTLLVTAMISGFMIVKDVLRQGYPFVEAIASALPICDEFLISDGYSTDGTYEVLNRIAGLNSKVKVYRYRWPDKKNITVLADVTNEVRSKCRFKYIFSVQANEIIHEESAPLIKALPDIHPSVDTFSLPCTQFVNKYIANEEFRIRLSKNLDSIVAISDAWTLGPSKAFLRVKKLKALANPRRLLAYVEKGIAVVYANTCYDILSRAFYLPKPVYRYWSLFPKNFLEKSRGHSELFGMQEFQKSFDILQRHVDDPETFWRLGCEFLQQVEFKEKGLHYPEFYNSVEKKEHPAIIQEFISNTHADSYYIRDELFEMLTKL
jgi:glycosyltransferase involved in cell wall biosynthesis